MRSPWAIRPGLSECEPGIPRTLPPARAESAPRARPACSSSRLPSLPDLRTMCGIAGIVYRDPQRVVDPHILRGMADQIAHRGPDGEGYWTTEGVGLAHRRLSIIDLAGGAQPLS